MWVNRLINNCVFISWNIWKKISLVWNSTVWIYLDAPTSVQLPPGSIKLQLIIPMLGIKLTQGGFLSLIAAVKTLQRHPNSKENLRSPLGEMQLRNQSSNVFKWSQTSRFTGRKRSRRADTPSCSRLLNLSWPLLPNVPVCSLRSCAGHYATLLHTASSGAWSHRADVHRFKPATWPFRNGRHLEIL